MRQSNPISLLIREAFQVFLMIHSKGILMIRRTIAAVKPTQKISCSSFSGLQTVITKNIIYNYPLSLSYSHFVCSEVLLFRNKIFSLLLGNASLLQSYLICVVALISRIFSQMMNFMMCPHFGYKNLIPSALFVPYTATAFVAIAFVCFQNVHVHVKELLKSCRMLFN